MPISLSQLTANRKACVVTFENVGELHIEYYPQRLTARMLADFAAVGNLAEMPPERAIELAASPIDVLADLLASWDLTMDEGGPVLPIDKFVLSGLGLPILWAIVAGIMTDGNGSGKASAPTASQSKRR